MATIADRVSSRRLRALDDNKLARLVHKGDEAAFEQLYDRHHRALLAFCRHMLGNREDGEEALQQTFETLAEPAPEVEEPPPVAADEVPTTPWLAPSVGSRCGSRTYGSAQAVLGCVPRRRQSQDDGAGSPCGKESEDWSMTT